MFETPAYAAAAGAAGGPNMIMQIAPLIFIIVIFYFFLIRPQQKRMKDHQAMVAGLRKGDTIVTTGGMIGKIIRVNDDELSVELAEGVRVRVVRSSVSEVRSKTDPAPANDSDA